MYPKTVMLPSNFKRYYVIVAWWAFWFLSYSRLLAKNLNDAMMHEVAMRLRGKQRLHSYMPT